MIDDSQHRHKTIESQIVRGLGVQPLSIMGELDRNRFTKSGEGKALVHATQSKSHHGSQRMRSRGSTAAKSKRPRGCGACRSICGCAVWRRDDEQHFTFITSIALFRMLGLVSASPHIPHAHSDWMEAQSEGAPSWLTSLLLPPRFEVPYIHLAPETSEPSWFVCIKYSGIASPSRPDTRSKTDSHGWGVFDRVRLRFDPNIGPNPSKTNTP